MFFFIKFNLKLFRFFYIFGISAHLKRLSSFHSAGFAPHNDMSRSSQHLKLKTRVDLINIKKTRGLFFIAERAFSTHTFT